jgi:hypothetical protein
MKRFTPGFSLLAMLLALVVSPALAAPANDNFADAQLLAGNYGSVTGSNVGATLETDEPTIPGDTASVWYRWVAPASGLATFHTFGSDFDTVLGVLSGDEVSDLTVLVYEDDSRTNAQSQVAFNAVAGTTYQIAVGSSLGVTGNIVLGWQNLLGELNDNFADALPLTGPKGLVISAIINATLEPGEPDHGQVLGESSVWFDWTAPTTGTVSFTVRITQMDSVMAVYQGTELASLVQVAQNDDFERFTYSQVAFTATAGEVYHIAIATFDDVSQEPSTGFVLEWEMQSVAPAELGLGVELTVSGLSVFNPRAKKARLIEAQPAGKRPKAVALRVTKGSVTDESFEAVAKTGKPGLYHLEITFTNVKDKVTIANAVTLRPPVVASVAPEAVQANDEVQITGSFFGALTGQVMLVQGKKRLRLKVAKGSWSDSSITAIIAKKAKPGEYTLVVTTKLGSSAPIPVTIVE